MLAKYPGKLVTGKYSVASIFGVEMPDETVIVFIEVNPADPSFGETMAYQKSFATRAEADQNIDKIVNDVVAAMGQSALDNDDREGAMFEVRTGDFEYDINFFKGD